MTTVAIGWVISVGIAGILAFAAAAKFSSVDASSRAIAGLLQIQDADVARRVTLSIGVLEFALGLAVVLQIAVGRAVAASFTTLMLAVHAWTLRTRGAGVPCGCYGPRSMVSRVSVTRLAALSGLAWVLVLAFRERVDPALMGWSVAALSVAACMSSMGIAVELARRVAALSEETGPAGALEIASEGPALGSIVRLPGDSGQARLSLAVFLSPACGLCRRLEPAIELFSSRPGVELTTYDEERDSVVWQLADVPGSPYAVARDASGRVLAKGAFNTMRQLESVCASAVRRDNAEGLDVEAA